MGPQRRGFTELSCARERPIFGRPADFVPSRSSQVFAVSRHGTFVPRWIVCASERASAAPIETTSETEVLDHVSWVVTFLVIALIAGILGFGGVAGASIEIAKIIFFIAVVLFLVSAVVGVARGRTRV